MTKPIKTEAELISLREFARRDGCSEKLVRDARKTGHLPTLPHGKLPASLVGTGWRQANRRSAEGSAEFGAECGVQNAETPHLTDEEIADRALRLLARGAPWSTAEAERVKENALAMTRQLEYDKLAAQVADVAAIPLLLGEACRGIRDEFLAFPAAYAPRLCRINDPREMQEALTAIVIQILRRLSDLDGSEENR